jgi:GT2 family glycosyltransferase
MSRRALVVVNYRSSSLALAAIRSARAASSEPLQVVVVDNSTDDAEAAALRSACDVLLTPSRNLGYAAAINLARRSIEAELMIVSNPDVIFGPASIDLLDIGAPIAGPALFWDDACQWHLPPADRYTTPERLDAALGIRSQTWAMIRDRRRTRHRIAFWSDPRTRIVPAISGAVMAIRLDAFDRLGGFDERFFLYFEETDFLRRAGEIMYVPAARCRHIYNQSAAGSAEAQQHYAESERKYLERWSGRGVTGVIKRLERSRTQRSNAAASGATIEVVGEHVVIEASPLPDFDTAAGFFPKGEPIVVPPEVVGTYRGDVLWLRVVERGTGRALKTYARKIVT